MSVTILYGDKKLAENVETIGDYIEISSDGTNFYAYGIGAAAGGITFTAP